MFITRVIWVIFNQTTQNTAIQEGDFPLDNTLLTLFLSGGVY